MLLGGNRIGKGAEKEVERMHTLQERSMKV